MSNLALPLNDVATAQKQLNRQLPELPDGEHTVGETTNGRLTVNVSDGRATDLRFVGPDGSEGPRIAHPEPAASGDTCAILNNGDHVYRVCTGSDGGTTWTPVSGWHDSGYDGGTTGTGSSSAPGPGEGTPEGTSDAGSGKGKPVEGGKPGGGQSAN